MVRMRRAVAWAAAFVAFGGLAAAPAGATKPGDVVAASPAAGSSIGSGHWFVLPISPGQSMTQKIQIGNNNDHQVNVDIAATDAYTSDTTGAVYNGLDSPAARTARWIVVSVPTITLAPKQGREVSFTVDVPNGTSPGQYLAAISVAVPLPTDASRGPSAGPRSASFSLGLQPVRQVAVEIDVPGPRSPKLAVTDVTPGVTPQGLTLGLHIVNQGNAFAHGSGVVRVADTNTDFAFKIDTFVPGTSIVYPAPWTKTVVAGLHHVEVDLTYEDGRRATWNGTVNIAGDAATQLENQLKSVTVSKASHNSLWILLAGLLLVVFVASALRLRRRRRPTMVKIQSI
jgi:Bacterial protein of unknown function (DUF916)